MSLNSLWSINLQFHSVLWTCLSGMLSLPVGCYSVPYFLFPYNNFVWYLLWYFSIAHFLVKLVFLNFIMSQGFHEAFLTSQSPLSSCFSVVFKYMAACFLIFLGPVSLLHFGLNFLFPFSPCPYSTWFSLHSHLFLCSLGPILEGSPDFTGAPSVLLTAGSLCSLAIAKSSTA